MGRNMQWRKHGGASLPRTPSSYKPQLEQLEDRIALNGDGEVLEGSTHELVALAAPVSHELRILEDVIVEGDRRRVIGPHHAGPGHPASPNTHFFAETGDAHHFAWLDHDPTTTNLIDIYYDFRPIGGFANQITAGQIAAVESALQMWQEAALDKINFIRNQSAPDADIINIGTGNLAALGYTSGPGGVLGLGGGDFTHNSDHTITGGVAWMDFADTWDETIGNGNPTGTFDYFTVAAQEIGHALGLGHTDDITTTDIMDGNYTAERTAASVHDKAHIRVAYATVVLVSQFDPLTGDNRYADVWGEGNYAYLGSYQGTGVAIIDIATPAAPVLVSQYTPASGGQFKDVVVQNAIGYFASDNGGGVHIVDLANPAAPLLLSRITSAISGFDSIHELFLDGRYLYLADSRTPTVKVFDVVNPAAPQFVRDILTTDPRFIHNITAINGRLFTSGWGGTTDIYDITNIGSQAPTLLGTVSSGSNSHSSWATDNNSILVSAREISAGDVRIYDVSNPASSVLLASITAASLGIDAYSPHNPMIVGDLLFISWYQAGVQVLDIRNPANPIHIGVYDTFSAAVSGFDGNWGVYPFLGLDRVLLSDLDGGLFVVDARSLETLPGITVSPTSGLVTTEAGGTAGFTVVLDSRPTADVTVAISSSDTSEGVVSLPSLTFTPANWSTPQTVIVAGVDDAVDDGDFAYTIFTAAATGAAEYVGINPADVSAVNLDNDTVGITVAPTSGLVTSEAGGTASFSVVLATQPTANVTIAISSSDTTEGIVSASALTFTPADWNVPQTVIVTGVDDTIDDGDVAYTVISAAATGAAEYAGINPADVSVTNLDNDPTANANSMFVWDILFESRLRGKQQAHDERIRVAIRRDSDANGIAESTDAPVAGATIRVVVTGPLTATFNGTTDSAGLFVSKWLNAVPNGTYLAEVTVLTHSTYVWNRDLDPTANDTDLDADNLPDQQHNKPHAALPSPDPATANPAAANTTSAARPAFQSDTRTSMALEGPDNADLRPTVFTSADDRELITALTESRLRDRALGGDTMVDDAIGLVLSDPDLDLRYMDAIENLLRARATA